MFKRIDRSQILLRALGRMSDLFSQKRGLPIIVGIIFVAISLVIQSLAVFSDNNVIEFLGVLTHNVGVLIALVGIILVTPLGGR
ncbi:MAG: hypothetical protein RLP44_03165 [Aggregatilineales bacterium]